MKTNPYIEQLKKETDIDPTTFDPSYELMTVAVRGLASVPRKSLDLPDLMMLYHLSIGTWKSAVPTKQQKVEESHLPKTDKEHLKEMLDKALADVEAGKYSHQQEGIFGIFGAARYKLGTPNPSSTVREMHRKPESNDFDLLGGLAGGCGVNCSA